MRPISGTMIRDVLLCERKAALDLHGDTSGRDPVSEFTKMLYRQGLAHEHETLRRLEGGVTDLRTCDHDERISGTVAAMQRRATFILGATLIHSDLIGMPDVLRWTPDGYMAQNVKSGAALEGPRQAYNKAYLVQVAHYAYILAQSGMGRGDIAGIIDRSGEQTIYDLNKPVGRDHASGAALHLRLLGEARAIRDREITTKGALGADCGMCEWKSRCRRELEERDDLTRITGLGRAIRSSLEASAGTVEELARLEASEVGPLPGIGIERLGRFIERARLMADPHAGPIAWEPLDLPTSHHVIDFDVEADPLRDIVYLHGFWHCRGEERTFVHFFAETADPAGEKQAFQAAIQHFRLHRQAHWFHYSQYERTAYTHLQRRHPDVCSQTEIDEIFAPERCSDIYATVAKKTDWPLSSYGIKSIAVACGFAWEDTDPGGANSVEWYDRFVATGDVALRERIVAYNRDDVRASEVVRNALAELDATGSIAAFRRPA